MRLRLEMSDRILLPLEWGYKNNAVFASRSLIVANLPAGSQGTSFTLTWFLPFGAFSSSPNRAIPQKATRATVYTTNPGARLTKRELAWLSHHKIWLVKNICNTFASSPYFTRFKFHGKRGGYILVLKRWKSQLNDHPIDLTVLSRLLALFSSGQLARGYLLEIRCLIDDNLICAPYFEAHSRCEFRAAKSRNELHRVWGS